jgi:hypothetical protein
MTTTPRQRLSLKFCRLIHQRALALGPARTADAPDGHSNQWVNIAFLRRKVAMPACCAIRD